MGPKKGYRFSAQARRNMSIAAKKRYANAGKAKPNGNGHPTMDEYRDHGMKYLEVRRDVLRDQLDDIDRALKLLAP